MSIFNKIRKISGFGFTNNGICYNCKKIWKKENGK